MKRIILPLLLLITYISAFSQAENRYQMYFNQAYEQYPNIPTGMLEAVAFTNTRFDNIDESQAESCTGMPKAWGVMGLILDGKDYFRNNLVYVSSLSEYSVDEIKTSPENQIMAYAKAFNQLSAQQFISTKVPEDYIQILIDLSEIPVSDRNNIGNDFALNSQLYSIYTFLDDESSQLKYGIPQYTIDMKKLFGENLKVLSSKRVNISNDAIEDENGNMYRNSDRAACPDYPFSNCSWVASPNYSSRSGTAITAVAMHTVQGSYSGCISWFQNTSASASTQYVVRSSDGQLTQMVLESNKAWHVGSENPYSIGYEHEGYVDNAAWYTLPMYQSSAALTKDICNAWNINTLRTFYRDTLDDGTVLDYGLHSLGGDGSCIKIKGHQHFPNQTHTDPGPNWNWDLYFKLINQGIGTTTTYTTATGTLTDSDVNSGNYDDDERLFWLIQPTNASSVTLTFSSFDLEDNYDFLYIYDGDNEFAPKLGRWNTQSPGTVTSSGGSLLVEFRSDCATQASGWTANWTSTSLDNTPPTTSISTSGIWKTDDFTATFTDADNAGGSGLEKSYYQVLDNNGTEWRANTDNGFFADNFDSSIHSDWNIYAGTWQITSGALHQTDETNGNSNIYAPLNQTLSNRYLYNFTAKISGSDANRRFGFHFFCDDANLENRGNSYFIWFRVDNQTLEFYKSINDVITQELVINNVITNADQWYDFKVIFDRISGKVDVYRDNVLLGTWTDSSPHTTGNYISFRTGNVQMMINELKVYRSRYPSLTVTVGAESTNDIRYQNPSPTTYGAKIKSIVNDAIGNLSEIAYHDLNVDWTAPSDVIVSDGTNTDVDIITSSSSLSANWTSSDDENSGIAKYWYSIGTSAGANDIIDWTDNGLNTSVTQNGLSLSQGQTYFVNVKVENNAGLISNVTSSNGQMLASSTVVGFTASSTNACTGDAIQFTNTSSNANSYVWTFEGGTPSVSTDENPTVVYEINGVFSVNLQANGLIDTVSLNETNLITVNALPVANFSVNDTLLELPGALALFENLSENANAYSWSLGDGYTTTDFAPWHIYDTLGYYTVTLVAISNVCGNDTLIMNNLIHVDIADNIQAIENSEINIYPNPFKNEIKIEFSDIEDITSINLYDLTGKEIICSNNIVKGVNYLEINIKGLSITNGIYIIKISKNEKAYYYKVVRE